MSSYQINNMIDNDYNNDRSTRPRASIMEGYRCYCKFYLLEGIDCVVLQVLVVMVVVDDVISGCGDDVIAGPADRGQNNHREDQSLLQFFAYCFF